jgi:protease I
MDQKLAGRRIAVLAADPGDETVSASRKALQEAGAVVDMLTDSGEPKSREGSEGGSGNRHVSGTSASEFAGFLILSGDTKDIALVRGDGAIQFAREMMLLEKPVAALGDGVRLLVSSDALTGRVVACPSALRAEVEGAGGHCVDEPVHADENLITCRSVAESSKLIERFIRKLESRAADLKVDELSESSFPASDPPPGPTALGGAGASRDKIEGDRPTGG